jgi:IclR family acetate operon transcriptional repressor
LLNETIEFEAHVVIQTADRAFAVVEQVARARRPCGLTDIASASGLDKSTASRMLAFLDARGLLERDASSKRYTVGPALMSLAAVVIGGSGLPQIAQPHLDRLRDESGETVSLHVRSGHERVCVAGAASRTVLQRVLTIGEPVALWSGPTSKMILACLEPADRADVLALAEAAGVSTASLARELDAARRRGYIITVGDRTPGVGAVSVPVLGPAGVAGALTAAGPAERWTRKRMRAFAPDLVATATRLSAQLGGPAPVTIPDAEVDP